MRLGVSFLTSGIAHLPCVLADAYIHELGENESAGRDSKTTSPARYAAEDSTNRAAFRLAWHPDRHVRPYSTTHGQSPVSSPSGACGGRSSEIGLTLNRWVHTRTRDGSRSSVSAQNAAPDGQPRSIADRSTIRG